MKKFIDVYFRSEKGGLNSASALIGFGVLLSAFFFYLLTLAPTVIWGDSAKFALKTAKLHLSIGADSHPLFILLGRIFSYLPFEAAYSLNLLTAITASLAVLMVYLVILELTGSVMSSVIGAASLALSHAFWLHAVIAEVYDLNAFFVAATVLTLLKWSRKPSNSRLLYLSAFIFGLGLCNHLILALTFFGFIFYVLMIDFKVFLRVKVLLATVFSFLAGNSLLIYIFIQKVTAGRAAPALVDAATGSGYKKSMFTFSAGVFKDLAMYMAYLFYQFPLIGFALGFIGIYALAKSQRRIAVLLLLLVGVNMIFFLTFGPGVQSTTKYTFYISDYTLFSVFIGYGAFSVMRFMLGRGYSLNKVASIIFLAVLFFPLSLYNIAPHATRMFGVDLLHARTIEYRDNGTYFLNPNKRGYTGAAEYAREVLDTASPDSIIVADFTPFTVLKYFQEVKGLRGDVMILRPGHRVRDESGASKHLSVKDIVTEHYGQKDIFLADKENEGYYRLRALRNDFDFLPYGILFQVVKKSQSVDAGAD